MKDIYYNLIRLCIWALSIGVAVAILVFSFWDVDASEYERPDFTEEMSAMPCNIYATNLQACTDDRVSLGVFRVTAYCSCHKCCGRWAEGRPVDENGKEIVYGASGQRLSSYYSIAVDPTVIPYGTKVNINGYTYEAMDTGVSGQCIDVYFDSHEEACRWGEQYIEIFLED